MSTACRRTVNSSDSKATPGPSARKLSERANRTWRSTPPYDGRCPRAPGRRTRPSYREDLESAPVAEREAQAEVPDPTFEAALDDIGRREVRLHILGHDLAVEVEPAGGLLRLYLLSLKFPDLVKFVHSEHFSPL